MLSCITWDVVEGREGKRKGGGNGGRKRRTGMGGEEYVISLSFDKSKINDCVASHKIGLLSIL